MTTGPASGEAPYITLWRIAPDTPEFTADDLSGRGAELSGGRWNRPGTPVVYASSSRALACLESIAHLGAGDLPLNRYLVEIRVPVAVWRQRVEMDPAAHVGWDAEPARQSIAGLGYRVGRGQHRATWRCSVGDRARGVEHPGEPSASGRHRDPRPQDPQMDLRHSVQGRPVGAARKQPPVGASVSDSTIRTAMRENHHSRGHDPGGIHGSSPFDDWVCSRPGNVRGDSARSTAVAENA